MHVLILLVAIGQFPSFATDRPVLFPSFRAAVQQQRQPKVELISFGATWCGPCKGMKTVVSEIEKDGVKVYRIDVDEFPAYMRSWKITTIPAVVVLRNGKEFGRHIGTITVDKLRAIITPREVRHEPSNSAK